MDGSNHRHLTESSIVWQSKRRILEREGDIELYPKESTDACYRHASERIRRMAGIEFGEDWDAFSVLLWIKDLRRGYFYEFLDGGKLKNTKIIEGQPMKASVVVSLTSDDYVGQHAQEVSLREKFDSGEMTISGDVEKMQRFSLFSDYDPFYPPGHPKANK
jgi:hypothetical protein